MSSVATTASSGLSDAPEEPTEKACDPQERLRSVTRPSIGVNGWRNTWYTKVRMIMVGVDAAMISVALFVTTWLKFGSLGSSELVDETPSTHHIIGIAFAFLWWWLLGVKETRSARIMGAGLEEYRRVIGASFLAFGLLAIFSYLMQADISRLFFLTTLPFGTFLVLLGRWLVRAILSRVRLNGRALTPTLIVGDEQELRKTLTHLRRNPAAGYLPVAVCLAGSDSNSELRHVDGLEVVRRSGLIDHVTNEELGAIVVAGGLSRRGIRQLAWSIENSPTQLLFVPRLTDVAGPRLSIRPAEGLDLLEVALPRYSGSKYWLKRSFDVTFAAAALLFLLPLLALIAVVIKMRDGGPALFRQERVGLAGRVFRIHKFRTMHMDAEACLANLHAYSISDGPLFKMDADPRVTSIGRLLRRYSLDELPQFWTVLRGDMSIVGPRPHLAHELAQFPDEGLRRLLIKPGITGLWQISGRSNLPIEDAIRLDLTYVENWSLSGDIAIVLRTITTVIQPEGAY